MIVFNMVLRSLAQSYIIIALAVLLNVANPYFETKLDRISTVVSILGSLVIGSLPIFFGSFLFLKRAKLQQPQIKKRIGMLYRNMNSDSLSLMYYPFFMLRRFMVALTIVFLFEYPFAQVQILMASSSAFFIYVTYANPQVDKLMDKVDFFNETCTIIMSYYVILFSTFYDDPEIKYEMGWQAIGLFLSNFLVNVLIIIYQTGRATYIKVKQFIDKRKLKKGKSEEP
jgi:hypothetical protein